MYPLNPAHALHGGVSYFAFLCVSVCVSVDKISQKILNPSTLWRSSLWPTEETIRFWKKSPQGKGGCGGQNLALMIKDRRNIFEWL